jgi:hypothetical protein
MRVKYTDHVLPDILFQADFDILEQFIIRTLLSVDSFRYQDRLQGSKTKDNAGCKPAGKDRDENLNCAV